MGSRKFLLLSVGLNLLLLAVFLFQKNKGPEIHPKPAPVQIKRETVVETKTNEPIISVLEIAAENFTWRDIESEDYATYIANLRAVGCPERTLQHIILEDLEKLFQEKQRQLLTERKLWITGPERDEQERQRRQTRLVEEKHEIMRTFLGREMDREGRKVWVDEAEAGWVLAFLTDEQAEQVLAIGHRFGRQMGEVLERREILVDEDFDRAHKLYKQMMGEFGRIASPQELEEGQLRMGLMINFGFSGKSKSLQLTEKELRQLVSLQLTTEDPFQKIVGLTHGGMGQHEKPHSPEYIAGARQLLGEERFTEFLCAQDADMKRFRKTTEKFGSPPDAVSKLFEVQQATLEEAEQIRNNQDLSRAEKRAELQALQEMSKQAVTEISGNNVADEYFKSRINWWESLRNP